MRSRPVRCWLQPTVTAGSSGWTTSHRPAATVACMTLSVSTSQAVDRRVQPVDEVLDRVARSLQVRLLPDTVVRKRRTVGARTDRETWVRIERRLLDKITDQGWNGAECAARLDAVAQPAWRGCVVWRDTEEPVMWRADETDLLPAPPVGNAVLSEAPELPGEWWDGLNASLDALEAHRTRRIATPDTDTITQASVTRSIRAVFFRRLRYDRPALGAGPRRPELGQRDGPGVQSLRLGGLGERPAGTGLRLAVVRLARHPVSGRSRTAGTSAGLGEPGRQADDAVRLLEDPRASRAP